MKKIFITGISGTLGQEVLKQLEQRPGKYQIEGLTRCEHKLKQITKQHPNVKMWLGDINEDLHFVQGHDFVFHFASLKHIDLIEAHFPMQGLDTILNGTTKVLKNCTGKMVFTSTDKAAYPINVYGCAKALAEKFVLKREGAIACRYGNVLASNGSVIHLFKKQIENNEPVTITSKDMTRFWISIEKAAAFVIDQAFNGSSGLRIPQMKGYNILSLAETIAEVLGKPLEYKVIGVRPGEKLHECLYNVYDGFSKDFYSNDELFTKTEIIELVKGFL